MEKGLERAAGLGVAMEINAQPDRMDLSDAHARLAREKGVTLVVDTDAHSIANLDLIRYGVFVARRAGLTREDVLNAWPYERMRKALRKGGGARGAATVVDRRAKAAPARKPAAKPAARGSATKPAAKQPAKPPTPKPATKPAPTSKRKPARKR